MTLRFLGGFLRAARPFGQLNAKGLLAAQKNTWVTQKLSSSTRKMLNMETCQQLLKVAGLPANLLLANLRRILEKNGQLVEADTSAVEECKISVQDLLLSIRITDISDTVRPIPKGSQPALHLTKPKQ